LKKVIISFLSIICITLAALPSYAGNVIQKPVVSDVSIVSCSSEYLGNGLYLNTELIEYAPANKISIMAASSSKSATLTSKVQDAKGNTLVEYTLSATFTYNGSTSSCTSVSHSSSAIASGWSFSSTSSSRSGNAASGSFTAVNKVLGITVQTIKRGLSITCTSDGTISKSIS
jgi:hypothetical protein